MSKRRSRFRLLTLAVSLTLIVIFGALALSIWLGQRGLINGLETRYETAAQELSARQYPRAPPPPGWSLEPGSAAEVYRAVHDEYQALGAPGASLDSAFDAAFPEDPDVLSATHDPARPLPPSCVALGFGLVAEKPIPAFDEPLCAHLLLSGPLLDRLDAATRREDTRSPVAIFDPWSVDAASPEQPRNLIPFITLARLSLLRAHARDLAQGSWRQTLEASFTVMRMGRDLSRGAHVIALFAGAAIEQLAHRAIHRLFARGVLPIDALDAVLAEGRHVATQPYDMRDAAQAEYLLILSIVLSSHDLDVDLPPFHMTLDDPGFLERVYHLDLARIEEPLLRARIDQAHLPPLVTATRAPEVDARSGGLIALLLDVWGNPLREIGHQDPLYFHVGVALQDARLRLLLLITAARKLQVSSVSPPPPSLDDLIQTVGLSPDLLLDPLTGRPFSVYIDQGHLFIESSARDEPALRSRLARHKDPLQVSLTW